MHFAWALIAWGLIMLVVSPGSADELFDSSQCKSDCVFRYNVSHDWGGAVLLPADSLRRDGYLKCMQKCDKEFWQNMSGPSAD